jgi:hypothetical protein
VEKIFKMEMKYIVYTFRNFKDFKFGTMRYEINSKGETTIYGRLKKNNKPCRFQEVKLKC